MERQLVGFVEVRTGEKDDGAALFRHGPVVGAPVVVGAPGGPQALRGDPYLTHGRLYEVRRFRWSEPSCEQPGLTTAKFPALGCNTFRLSIAVGDMRNTFAARAASAATAIMLLGACSDDSPTNLANGEDVDFVGSDELGDQTMDITAQEEDGEVTGEVSFEPHGSVASLQCSETEADGVRLIGGEFTTVPEGGDEAVGQWMAIVIREGDPDSAFVWLSDLGTEAPESCDDALEQVPDPSSTRDAHFVEVEGGDDIETG
jgi:hypothetical protein